jgi:hypothetical protein
VDVETDVPRLKGALILTQRKVMEEIVGADRLARALEKLPDEVRLAYEAVTPFTWFPAEWFNAVVAVVADEMGTEVLTFHAEVLRTSLERTFSLLWRAFLHITSDEALISRTPLFWSRSYTQGELTSRFKSYGEAEVTLRGWPEVPDIQIQAVRKGIETVMKLAGRKWVKVTSERRPSGALFHVTWRP